MSRLPHSLDTRFTDGGEVKVKLSLYQAVEVHTVVRRRGSHIFYTIGSQMTERLSALHAGPSPRKISGTHFC
jgi:hypothetical protein